jgi:hypothetical protein
MQLSAIAFYRCKRLGYSTHTHMYECCARVDGHTFILVSIASSYTVYSGWAWTSPEYARDRKRFYMYVYIYMFVGWSFHLNFEPHIGNGRHAHTCILVLHTIWMITWQMICTCRQRHVTGKMSAGPCWQGSGSQLVSLVQPWAWWWLHGGLSLATMQHHWTTSSLRYLHCRGNFRGSDRN